MRFWRTFHKGFWWTWGHWKDLFWQSLSSVISRRPECLKNLVQSTFFHCFCWGWQSIDVCRWNWWLLSHRIWRIHRRQWKGLWPMYGMQRSLDQWIKWWWSCWLHTHQSRYQQEVYSLWRNWEHFYECSIKSSVFEEESCFLSWRGIMQHRSCLRWSFRSTGRREYLPFVFAGSWCDCISSSRSFRTIFRLTLVLLPFPLNTAFLSWTRKTDSWFIPSILLWRRWQGLWCTFRQVICIFWRGWWKDFGRCFCWWSTDGWRSCCWEGRGYSKQGLLVHCLL